MHSKTYTYILYSMCLYIIIIKLNSLREYYFNIIITNKYPCGCKNHFFDFYKC